MSLPKVRLLIVWLAALGSLAAQASVPAGQDAGGTRASVFVLIGAPGEEVFRKEFEEAAILWKSAAESAEARCVVIGSSTGTNAPGSDATNDIATFRKELSAELTNGLAELWIVMIGHGTWDGREAHFNLRGPDIGAAELASWLQPFSRPIAVINGASASAPFINALSRKDRVVISATKSGSEDNYARFGSRISRAIASPVADLDKDGQTSLLEAFLFASRQVEEFYKTEGRLSTEHALLDDNGDARGTPAEFFRGVRAVKTPAEGDQVDGLRAHQWHLVRNAADRSLSAEARKQRDDIELKIGQLRQRKGTMPEADYYRELEKLLRTLSPFLETPKQ